LGRGGPSALINGKGMSQNCGKSMVFTTKELGFMFSPIYIYKLEYVKIIINIITHNYIHINTHKHTHIYI
jgi:hypothetical protein